MKSSFWELLHNLNLHSQVKVYAFKSKRKGFLEKALRFFIEVGLVETYLSYKKLMKFRIYMKFLYRSKRVLQKLVPLSTSYFIFSCKVDLISLVRMDFPYGTILLSTDLGFLPDYKAIEQNKGGYLLCWCY
jgi:ribosomal protein S8